jgi:hypothetical protein
MMHHDPNDVRALIGDSKALIEQINPILARAGSDIRFLPHPIKWHELDGNGDGAARSLGHL